MSLTTISKKVTGIGNIMPDLRKAILHTFIMKSSDIHSSADSQVTRMRGEKASFK